MVNDRLVLGGAFGQRKQRIPRKTYSINSIGDSGPFARR